MFKLIFFIVFRRIPFNGVLEIEFEGKVQRFGTAGKKIKIKVLDKEFFKRIVLYTDTGFGESYFLEYFITDDLKETLLWFEANQNLLPDFRHKSIVSLVLGMARSLSRLAHRLNKNTRKGSLKNIKAHYDVSNDFYKLWLDPSMTYSAAVFEDNETLEEAQKNKYKKLCEKIELCSSDHVLEIGSGWGGFSTYAVKNYGCKVTAVTISQNQFEYAKELFEREGINESINLLFSDYRDLQGSFDKIVSIEMMEALGHEYVPVFIDKCNSLLKKGGSMGLQFITYPDEFFDYYLKNQNYIKKHIFPGGELLSLEKVKSALSSTNELEVINEMHIGQDYAKTLNAWGKNFLDKKDAIMALGFDRAFFLKWYFYFVFCEVGFETSYLDDVQIAVHKHN